MLNIVGLRESTERWNKLEKGPPSQCWNSDLSGEDVVTAYEMAVKLAGLPWVRVGP